MLKYSKWYKLMLSLLVACDLTNKNNRAGDEQNNRIGGPCSGIEEKFQAVVIEIKIPPADENRCPNDPRAVIFALKKNNDDKPESFSFGIGDGKHPPQSCLEPNGIKLGATFEITRYTNTQGSCTPVSYRPSLPNRERCDDDCFKN